MKHGYMRARRMEAGRMEAGYMEVDPVQVQPQAHRAIAAFDGEVTIAQL